MATKHPARQVALLTLVRSAARQAVALQSIGGVDRELTRSAIILIAKNFVLRPFVALDLHLNSSAS